MSTAPDATRFTVLVAYTTAAAEVLPDTYAAVVRGTKAEIDSLLEQCRAQNPGGDVKAIRCVDVDAAEAFNELMTPF